MTFLKGTESFSIGGGTSWGVGWSKCTPYACRFLQELPPEVSPVLLHNKAEC